jgi:hypothetical protein
MSYRKQMDDILWDIKSVDDAAIPASIFSTLLIASSLHESSIDFKLPTYPPVL